jgi:hypothetical protein
MVEVNSFNVCYLSDMYVSTNSKLEEFELNSMQVKQSNAAAADSSYNKSTSTLQHDN